MSDGVSRGGTIGRIIGIILSVICGIPGILISLNPKAMIAITPDQASFVGGIMAFAGFVALIAIAWDFNHRISERKDYLNAHKKYVAEITSNLKSDELHIVIVDDDWILPDYKQKNYLNRPEFQTAIANAKVDLRRLGITQDVSQSIISTTNTTDLGALAKTIELPAGVPSPAPPQAVEEQPIEPAKDATQEKGKKAKKTSKTNGNEPPKPIDAQVLLPINITAEQMRDKLVEILKKLLFAEASVPILDLAEQLVKEANNERLESIKGSKHLTPKDLKFEKVQDFTETIPGAAAYVNNYCHYVVSGYCDPFFLDDGTYVNRYLLFTEVPEPIELEQVDSVLKRVKGLPPWKELETKSARAWFTEIGRVKTSEHTIPAWYVSHSHRQAHDFIRAVITAKDATRIWDEVMNRYSSDLESEIDSNVDDYNAVVQRAEKAESQLDDEKKTNDHLRQEVIEAHRKAAEMVGTAVPRSTYVSTVLILGILLSIIMLLIGHFVVPGGIS